MGKSYMKSIGISNELHKELEIRKKALTKRIGRVVSYDEVIKSIIGWRI